MPWEKQFDINAALDAAMRTFWSKGYDATSIQDLVDAMGINRGSIYDTFGDKHNLYLESLKRYEMVERKGVLDALRQGRTPREAMEYFFDVLVSETVARKKRDGCFLVNTALEVAPHDEVVAKVVAGSFEDTERYFRELIREGQALGEFKEDINARDVARMLLAATLGIRVISRSWPEKSVLNSIAAQALALLA